jgi:hypothetical protein
MGTKYARQLSVGLSQRTNDLLNAAVAQREMTISAYIRRALRSQFTADGVGPPVPSSRARKHDQRQQSEHAVA